MCNAAFCEFVLLIMNFMLIVPSVCFFPSQKAVLFVQNQFTILKACFSGQSLRSVSSVSSAVCLAGRKAGLFGCRLLGDSV